MIRIQTANNIPNLFYKVMPALQYHRVPAKYMLNEGIADIKPYSKETVQAIKSALEALNVKYTEVDGE